MLFTVGIGIVTYNRMEILSDTIDTVRAMTRQSNAALVVADDGSTDGTLEMLRQKRVPVITGANMGIAWNKNRALFLLSHMLKCETTILLEDDTRPTCAGWEAEWIDAAHRWGHVNYARDFMRDNTTSGSGTAADPYVSKDVTAQASSFSSTCLTYGGYFDPRFTGYGYEHVEHSRRMVRLGYGGTDDLADGREQALFYLIKGDLTEVRTKSFHNTEQEERNLDLARRIMGNEGYRAPWGDDSQMRQFRHEIGTAMKEGAERFRLTPAVSGTVQVQTVEPGFLSRMLNRS
jgi:glycosyltransferase involved in cell wall biosynthesis